VDSGRFEGIAPRGMEVACLDSIANNFIAEGKTNEPGKTPWIYLD
jgi:hypothetical protein